MKVFYSSPWVPAEWLEAHGRQACGVWFADNLCRNALPLSAGVCAFSEAVLRFAETHPEAAMIFTTACDQMRRGFDAFAAAHGGRAFLFNLPATWQSAAAQRIFRSELERLGRFLQAHGSRAPAAEDLAQIIERRAQARQRLRELAPRCSARQFAEAVARFHWDGSTKVPDSLPPPAPSSIPLAIVGGPLTASQWELLDLIEAAGARVVLNATETGERSLLSFEPPEGFGLRWQAKRDAALEFDNRTCHTIQKRRRRSALPAQSIKSVSESKASSDPFDFLARHYFDNIVDVFQRPNTRLYAWLKDRLAARGARGIVLWVHTGCDLWRAEVQTLRETFRLPVLLLEADEVPGGSPREAGRLQAFVETLQ